MECGAGSDGMTQIKIKSSCFDKPIVINMTSDDSNIKVLEEFLKNILLKDKPNTDNEPTPI
jgi:hypothetical protein